VLFYIFQGFENIKFLKERVLETKASKAFGLHVIMYVKLKFGILLVFSFGWSSVQICSMT